MASSKFERELSFMAHDYRRKQARLEELVEQIPETPEEAKAKADEIQQIQATLAQYTARKKEIEDSFRAVGMEVPDITKSINENGCRDSVADSEYVKPEPNEFLTRGSTAGNDLTTEIKDITDEIMQIEIKLLQAEVDGNESEKAKLTMSADALRSRRETLIAEMRESNAAGAENEGPQAPVDDGRMDKLEADNRALRSQITDLRSDITDLKDDLRQILDALNIRQ